MIKKAQQVAQVTTLTRWMWNEAQVSRIQVVVINNLRNTCGLNRIEADGKNNESVRVIWYHFKRRMNCGGEAGHAVDMVTWKDWEEMN